MSNKKKFVENDKSHDSAIWTIDLKITQKKAQKMMHSQRCNVVSLFISVVTQNLASTQCSQCLLLSLMCL